MICHMSIRRWLRVLCSEVVGLLLRAIRSGAVTCRRGLICSAVSAGRGGHRTGRVRVIADGLACLERIASILVSWGRI